MQSFEELQLATRVIERQCRYFRFSAFPFFLRNSERWGLKSGLA